MDFVVNEWLPEYFRPTATREEKLQLETFLNRFLERGDRILVRNPSPFLDKIHRDAKDYQTRHEIVTPIRKFIKLILQDSERCVLIDEEEFEELPESVMEKLEPGNFSSDQYLFEAASRITAEKLIVTTDARLKAQFSDQTWCDIVLLSEFLETY
jgi:PHD/YefM family antitoxin component YafN of YafNO toxin-antitoxin module